MVDAMLLEWDGVLADTGDARRESMLHALRNEGVTMNDEDYDVCCAGLDVRSGATAALRHAGLDDPTLTDLVALRASRRFMQHLSAACLLNEGVINLFSYGSRRSRLAIVTRASRAETDLFVEIAALDLEIVRSWTADDVRDAPPAPDVFNAAAAHLGSYCSVRRQHTVALVATTPAIRAARAAGVRVLAVGAPPHVAMEADGAVDSLMYMDLDRIAALAGITSGERST